jgi:hypothetical protein
MPEAMRHPKDLQRQRMSFLAAFLHGFSVDDAHFFRLRSNAVVLYLPVQLFEFYFLQEIQVRK